MSGQKIIFVRMKNIVFDLGGVVFERNPHHCPEELIAFFSFIRQKPMPEFWVEYDRGTLSLGEVARTLARIKACDERTAAGYIAQGIALQEEIAPTRDLIADLKRAGYRLYVLSNMSREFIDFLRRKPVYRNFDGEVVSCEEGCVKPEAEIYRRLLTRYGLDPAETLFTDDRQENLDAAAAFGIRTHLFLHHEAKRSCAELRARLLQ